MARDIVAAYRAADAFKHAHVGRCPPELRDELRAKLKEALHRAGLTQVDLDKALDATEVGMSWVAAMVHTYDLPLAATIDVTYDVGRNIQRNVPGLDAASVEMGVGGGWYTGLLTGLILGTKV